MKAIRSFMVFLLCSIPLFAQEYSVSGKVENASGEPLPYLTVLVFSENNTTIPFAGTTCDEQGAFVITNLAAQPYRITFSFIGYETQEQLFELSNNTTLPTITMREATEALQETVITGRKPMLQKEQGKLIFTVENSSIATGNTMELLSKTPSVLILQDKITIKNMPATIYLNGRRVYLSETEVASFLRNMDASNIKSIEVISNPSAKYDAEAVSVLNIITVRPVSVGYKGSVEGRYEQAVYAKYSVGTSHFYKNDWLDLFGSYSFNPRKEFKEQFDEIRFFNVDEITTRSFWETNFTRTTNSYAHHGNLIADITLNKRNSFSIASNIFISPNTAYHNTVYAELFNAQRQLDSTFRTKSDLENDQKNLSFTAEYRALLDDTGTSLTTTLNFIAYDDQQHQSVLTNYFLPNGSSLRSNSFFTDALQDSDIATGAIDLKVPGESQEWETGIKYSNIDSQSGLDFFNTNNNVMEFDPALSDEFTYLESIFAGYINFSKQWQKWDLVAGLRTEFTAVEGDSRSLGLVNNQEYLEFFPSLSLQYTVNDSNSLGVSFARRIERPRYQSLNPFKYFLNENNFNGGNPNLMPAIDSKFTISYNYKSKWFVDVYYHHTDNALSTLRFQDNENFVMRTVDANLIEDFQYSLDILHVSSPFPWWYLSAYLSGFYFENEFFALESQQETYSNSTYGFYGNINNNFTLSKDKSFTGDVTAFYLSDFIYGSYDYGNQFSLSFSLRKSFWENTASVSAGVSDVFNTYNVPVFSNYYNQQNSYFAKPESRLFRMSFKYTFGNARLRDNNRESKPEETDRLEKN
ncbi:MAG: TonB-dependent receptor [Altibacter sp.]|nr:TonB-dependent receptor [Altibacter sp.]